VRDSFGQRRLLPNLNGYVSERILVSPILPHPPSDSCVMMSLTGDPLQPSVCPDDLQSTHIFCPILIDRQVHCSKTSSSYLLLDDILVDPVDRCAVIVVVTVMSLRIERGLDSSRARGGALVMPEGSLVDWVGPAPLGRRDFLSAGCRVAYSGVLALKACFRETYME
jgi:hypothetical protein